MPYGSWNNHEYGRMRSRDPEIGMGATEICWTDRHAYTVIAMSPSKKTVTVQRDRVKRLGPWPSEDYEITPDPEGYTMKLRLCKDGVYRCKRTTFVIGFRQEYRDPSF